MSVPAMWRRIVARQTGDLGRESLEAEVDAERRRVLLEQGADGGNVVRRESGPDDHHRFP
jgi:hypothetical protein